MRPDPRAEGERWLAQAERDLDDARFLTESGRHHLACYLAQQSAEKALKAVRPELSSIVARGATLDKFYVPTRYPNALPGGIPAEAFDAADAGRAIADAAQVMNACCSAVRS